MSVSLSDELDAYVEELPEKGDADSKADAVRIAVRAHRENTSTGESAVQVEYEDKIEELERDIERLHRERRQLLEQREENAELVRYAQSEREAAERREERRHANVFRRAWWYLAGTPADETTD